MGFSPRTNRLALALFVACGTFAPCLGAQWPATSRAARQAPAAETKQSAKPARDEKSRARRLRQKAVAVLLEVAGGASEIEDKGERAAILTFCADALWEADEQSARSLFRRAWAAATEADEADSKDGQEGSDGDSPDLFTDNRHAVLAAATRRDARTGEAFLRELTEWLVRHKNGAGDTPDAPDENAASRDIGMLDELTPGGQRLALASSLLDAAAYKNAAAVAEPALASGVSGALVEFLIRLRASAPDEADRLYLGLLERTRARAGADANDVLLLSSYALTPRLLAVVDRRGSVQFRPLVASGAGAAADASQARARAAFFEVAADILLRPAPPGADEGASLAPYFAVGRLLPFFEREAPQYAPSLAARLAVLAAEVGAGRRGSFDPQMKTERLTPENPDDPLARRLDEIKNAPDFMRDGARFFAVRDAARLKLWERARSLADEIENEEGRQAARYLIAAGQVASIADAFADGDADDFERAAEFVRRAGLSPALAPTLRAYGLARAADLAARRGKKARAASLLDEAIAYARQTDDGTSLRDAAAIMTATVAARLDSPRAWEMLNAAVADLNADDDFSGSAVQFGFEKNEIKYWPGEREALAEAFATFTLEALFDTAARKDFDRAVAAARDLKDGPARAYALSAAARAALEKSPAASQTPAGVLRRGGK